MWTLVVTLLFPIPEFDGRKYIGVRSPNIATNVTTIHKLPSKEFCDKTAQRYIETQTKVKRFGNIEASYTCTQEIMS